MKLYNSLSKKIEEFTPINSDSVTIYSCGPTVYNYAHIGNLRTYINTDMLRRTLKSNGYKIRQAMNITDIEDKIINASREQNVEISEITTKYEKVFFDDLDKLNIEKVECYPHATTSIPEMIKIIQSLLKKEFAYKSEDGSIYFSIYKFKEYGKLSGLDLKELRAGARVDQDEYDKESAQDFVLWKAKRENEPSWQAPFGDGRPGWSIECSAMSLSCLGESIDIHTGGVDLLFPHHENEIAQSEAYTGKKFVNYWFHGEFLLVNGQKMSKSLNNIFTLDEICKKYDVSPIAFRLLCLMSHYREKLNFTDSSIVQSQNTLNGLQDFIQRLKSVDDSEKNLPVDIFIKNSRQAFFEAIDNDIATPKALAAIFEFIKEVNKLFVHGIGKTQANEILNYMYEIDKVLGLDLTQMDNPAIPENVASLLTQRDKARNKRDWAESDNIRGKILTFGYEVEDTNSGQKLRKIK